MRLVLLFLGASALAPPAPKHTKKIGEWFADSAADVVHERGAFEDAEGLGVDALLAPFVAEARFKTPYVKVLDDASQTFRYEQDGAPQTPAEALATLDADAVSYVLRYEHLSLDEWPAALRALLPSELEAELTENAYEGGVTVHAYISPPGAVALPGHHDIGDVLVLQLAGEKAWTLDGGQALTLKDGDALWVPARTGHSAVATDGRSVHLTIHRVSADDLAKEEESARRLNHKTGDDTTWPDDNDATYRDDMCEYSDASCGGYGSSKAESCPCNKCNFCSDAGAFCINSASDMTFGNPCCAEENSIDDLSITCKKKDSKIDDAGTWSIKDVAPDDALRDCTEDRRRASEEERRQLLSAYPDIVFVYSPKPFLFEGEELSYPKCYVRYGCPWVAQAPEERCNEKGVFLQDVGHYGVKWLLKNQPRYKAKDACPVACGGSGGGGGGDGGQCEDDPDWKYKPKGKKKQNCKDVAQIPKKRCKRKGLDGRKAKKACPVACKDYGGKCPKKKKETSLVAEDPDSIAAEGAAPGVADSFAKLLVLAGVVALAALAALAAVRRAKRSYPLEDAAAKEPLVSTAQRETYTM
jgi:mannose-6-phosphate isomerase-like protein (cupin superfamily)